MPPFTPYRGLLIQHAIIWSAVVLVASGTVDRAFIPADPTGPRRYCEVPASHEWTRVAVLADLCVGIQEPVRSQGAPRDLLPAWDEAACQKAGGPGGLYSKMAMIPAGSQIDVVYTSPSFSLNMGTARSVGWTTYLYDAGEPQPWNMKIPDGDGGGLRALKGTGAGSPIANCAHLFSFINRLDERPEDWTIFYSASRAIWTDLKSFISAGDL